MENIFVAIAKAAKGRQSASILQFRRSMCLSLASAFSPLPLETNTLLAVAFCLNIPEIQKSCISSTLIYESFDLQYQAVYFHIS